MATLDRPEDVLMEEEMRQREPSLFRTWTWATMRGWLSGLVLVLVLAMAWDMFGGGAQFMVGVGMGAGVGYMQARVIRTWTRRILPWFWASTIGMGTPFLLWDIGAVTGIKAESSLPVCVLLGGLLAGVLQQRLLRHHFERTSWWIPACLVGWGLPAGGIALGDSGLALPALKVLSTIVMFFGGLPLGAVTGKALEWMSTGEPVLSRCSSGEDRA